MYYCMYSAALLLQGLLFPSCPILGGEPTHHPKRPRSGQGPRCKGAMGGACKIPLSAPPPRSSPPRDFTHRSGSGRQAEIMHPDRAGASREILASKRAVGMCRRPPRPRWRLMFRFMLRASPSIHILPKSQSQRQHGKPYRSLCRHPTPHSAERRPLGTILEKFSFIL